MSIRKTYAYHRPGPEAVAKIAKIRQAYSDLHDVLEQLAPGSRERSLAVTALEESAMWAVKAVVVNDPASAVDPDSWPKDHAAPADKPTDMTRDGLDILSRLVNALPDGAHKIVTTSAGYRDTVAPALKSIGREPYPTEEPRPSPEAMAAEVAKIAPAFAYQQGKAAVKSGVDAAHICPYPADTEQRAAWIKGYTDHRGY